MKFTVNAQLVDYHTRSIYPAKITVENKRIAAIERLPENAALEAGFIMPGFVDSHIHIESSMLVPSEFARLAVIHGTIATISDPHEIANVCGVDGVHFMINNGKTVPFKFNFGAPSCVPATTFETAGDELNADQVEELLKSDDIKYLSEMMNFPGVLYKDEQVMKKIASAHRLNKPVDGHAPGLRGEQARQYIAAGISTDHECFTAEEALDKLKYGMKIIIREGSAAKNFEALIDLLNDHESMIMFCSDDKHPDSLVQGHINQLCARAVKKGIDLFKIIRAATINPVEHYKIRMGVLRVSDPADFIIVNNLTDFKVIKTFIEGEVVAENGVTKIQKQTCTPINKFHTSKKSIEDFSMPSLGRTRFPVIEALDGQLITNSLDLPMKVKNDTFVSDVDNDILKIVVVNRYSESPIAKAFIRNFGLKSGALASSVAHDSHNIVAVGVDDESLCRAVNLIIEAEGGVSCVDGKNERVVALPVAGLMSAEDGFKVADEYTAIDQMSKGLGSKLGAPFMTLSFMALLVIPHLKLSDKGLFDGGQFKLLYKPDSSPV
jgi:adenine deaminase